MKSLRERALDGEVLAGTFLVMGSGLIGEIAGRAGFDWAVIDMEHGMADLDSLLHQLQAIESTPCKPIIRVVWNQPHLIKRVLDMGSHGIMIPYVSTAAEAREAARALRYPPEGVRGLTPLSRPSFFGREMHEYVARANRELITVVQIENAEAVRNAEAIAATDGVDVLFIGPMDLSLGLGVLGQFDSPVFKDAVAQVVAACRKAGKAAGTLLLSPSQIDQAVADGFTFIAMSSDAGEITASMCRLAEPFRKFKKA
jgi:4-hydroxy-2-oxoheptanedioate aldolase